MRKEGEWQKERRPFRKQKDIYRSKGNFSTRTNGWVMKSGNRKKENQNSREMRF